MQDFWLRPGNAFTFTNKLALSLTLFAFVALIFFQGLYRQTHSRKHWLVDRLHRTAHKPSQYECKGPVCVRTRVHVSVVYFRGAIFPPPPSSSSSFFSPNQPKECYGSKQANNY